MTVLGEIAARARDVAQHADRATLVAAGWHVLDTMACVFSGATHPLTERWLPLLPPGPADGFVAAGVPGRWSLATTVEIESTLAHLDEFDPLHGPAAIAPGAVVVPAALQVGAAQQADDTQIARAVVAGYEAVIEASLRFGGANLYQAGWWPTALFGALGSAAATATLLDLDQRTTTTALGIAASPLGGLLSHDDLGDAHYLLCGRAAAHGMWAAHAARAGITASATLLDQPAALGPAASSTSDASAHITATGFKKWPCARPLHAALAALAATGVSPKDGDSIEIALPTPTLRFVTNQREPASPVEAAASATVVMAGASAGRADDPGWYRDIAARRVPLPDITVHLRSDPTLDTHFPARWGAEVTVHSGGTTRRNTMLVAPGDPDRPLSDEELISKAAHLGLPDASSQDRIRLSLDPRMARTLKEVR
ncbi:MmgE/PrpD family protein [Nocardia sp. CA2R105]|uniref:MmgE/PrpD family protein n=1 Tax=Nocardia coffeae TaxID=2873381 RepID=UPI001CA73962|nr:MmgE/PrpD family protein [Nocardia coffeae]MBY8856776.1 MmgE/PrpD family protein [Nocardia coffeae]